MALVGHWLHFGYTDMLGMKVSILLDFFDEAASLAESSKGQQ